MKTYKLIKIKDVEGEEHEFEDVKMFSLPFIGFVIIYQKYAYGTIKRVFYKRNIISINTV